MNAFWINHLSFSYYLFFTFIITLLIPLSFLMPTHNKCRSESDSFENDNAMILSPNFEHLIHHADEDDHESLEPSPELMRLLEQEAKEIQPHKELTEVINLGTDDNRKELKIGTCMKKSECDKLIKLLFDYSDVFAWSYQDMPGLDTDIVEHKLPLKPECPPVKQKLRRMKADMLLKIREEVKK